MKKLNFQQKSDPKANGKSLVPSKFKRNGSSSRARQRQDGDRIDELFGYQRFTEGAPRLGWLLNYTAMTLPDSNGVEKAGMDLYFIDRDGANFKASIIYDPYFFVDIDDSSRYLEVSNFLARKYEGCYTSIVEKEDLDLPNHLAGIKRKLIKISFNTVSDLIETKSKLRPIIEQNKKKQKSISIEDGKKELVLDPLMCLIDMREYDVPYVMRVSIDLDIRVGAWYIVTPQPGVEVCSVDWQKDFLELCEPKVLAFDIECEKSPLKFPNSETDKIFMISYMTPNQGYLIINREVVSKDIEDFEYTPKPSFPGPFKVFNVENEEAVLRTFIAHVQELKPHIIVTYNGDKFDWPYVEVRCSKYKDLSLYSSLGVRSNPGDQANDSEYTGRCMVHLDAFCWVQRDSYLPQGNQGLKAVTKYKLGYDPVEVDPEDMLRFAKEKPDYMASYSVSDAVATYYLYTTYVHNFIFSLCTIIPLCPEEVLRKGSGTLCEALLMVQAYQNNIVCPNKQVDEIESFHNGHLLESETYIGGHVECLEAGVFRADIPVKFTLIPSAFQQLLDHIDRDLAFAIETEHGMQRSDIVNYDTVKQYIVERLEMLRDSPNRVEAPVIYHLDVGAMYPNIILTNRLQPSGIVNIEDCAACKFNQASNGCKRPMTWTWRGEYNPAGSAEYSSIRRQLTYEKIESNGQIQSFSELSEKAQATMVSARLKTYAQKVYRKTKVTEVEDRTSTVCMREHSFYVDTVKAFRDRRYDYKILTKTWKNKKVEADKKGDQAARKIAEDREILMDSLQLAHKCILNSFYGYVMRKGARWRSMEMAGIVTYTGAQLIRQARELVEQVGRPLELDTDGIWCILPASFPQDVKFKTTSGSSISIGYPCAMLNADVHERYTNHQYQVLDSKDPTKSRYLTHSECSIFFELDGPYKAMVLPASPEEGKLLKKKYVVYNFNGSIAELKGFELKRRGELELVKLFQSQVFEQFLSGKTLQECYEAVGSVANQWLDVLDEKGVSMDDDELLHLISERKTISKTVEEYEGRKSTSLTTAGRLADFLGAEMIKDKGLNCNLVISRLPAGAPTTERAIPVAIFSCEPAMRRFFLRKWLKDSSLDGNDFRDIIDWEYYKERLGKAIQKIITIPAGMQSIANPCPRVEHPDWIANELAAKASGKKQLTLKDAFKASVPKGKFSRPQNDYSSSGGKSRPNKRNLDENDPDEVLDLEDIGKPKGLQKFSPSKSPEITELEEEEVPSEEQKAPEEVKPAPSFFSSPPSSTAEFNSWLTARKKQWDSAKIARKLQQASGTYHPSNKKSAGVLDFVRNAAISTKYSAWQILELQELDTPGEFLVWAMISPTQLQRLKLTVPRVLYVNITRNSVDAIRAAVKFGGIKVFKELPHSKETQELYEITLPELKFQRNEKSIDRFFNSAEVEGLYESQVPLWFRSILKLGCVAKVLQESTNNTFLTTGKYNLNDLEMVSVKFHPYLTDRSAVFKRIFIYYSATSTRAIGTIGILGIFNIKSTNAEEEKLIQDLMEKLKLQQEQEQQSDGPKDINLDDLLEPLSGKSYIWIINGKTGANLISKPPFNRIYRKYQPDESIEMKFTSTFVHTPEDAFRLANSRIEQIYRERNGPTLIISQGGVQQKDNTYNYGFDKKQWRKHMPALNEFPILIMPSNSLDEAFPSVGWQYFAAEKMIQRFFIFPKWFKERLHSARFASIPVCNFSNDSLTDMMDIAFARQLNHHRSILWASETPGQPDLGQGTSADQDLWSVWSEAQKEPVINQPGVYRTVCIELDIFGLAVCAIMSSNELDAEGLTMLGSSVPQQQTGKKDNNNGIGNFMEPTAQTTSSSFAESGCGKAFNVLKSIVAKCIEEVSRTGDAISDQLLNGIYRYLCGYGNGYLTDPLLHRIVYSFMIKLFWKIISSFRELGSKVIFANLNKIIICTTHYDVEAAKEYVDFILNALSLKPTFAYLHMTIKAYWEQMIWIDSENWSGLQPLKEFEAIQEQIKEEKMLLREARQKEREEREEEERKEQEVRQSKAAEVQKLIAKENAKKKKKMSNFFGGKPAAAESDEEDEEQLQNSDEERKETNKRGKQDYSFLDDIQGDGDINLNDIKKKTNQMKFKRLSYDSDEDNGSLDDEERYYEEEEDGNVDEYEGRGSSRKKRYDSIGALLDTFEDSKKRHDGENIDEIPEDDTPASPLVQHWNMINHLPPAAVTYFQYTIEEFIFQYVSCQKTLLEEELLKNDVYQHEHANSLSLEGKEDIQIQIIENMKAWISQFLTNKLLTITDDLQIMFLSISSALFEKNPFILYDQKNLEMLTNASSSEMNYYQNMKSVAFEFVKAISFVLLLDDSLKDNILSMRRLLLAQLHEQEFSIESEFRNPNMSYILPDVICSYCSLCRDIDLLRDDSLVLVEPSERWKCTHCQNYLNTEEIENRLLNELNKLTAKFYLQDFYCPKTNLVSQGYFTIYSKQNAQKLRMNFSMNEMKKQLYIFLKIANIYHFEYLQLLVEELLQKK